MKKTFLIISLLSLFISTSCATQEVSKPAEATCKEEKTINLLACKDLSNWAYSLKDKSANPNETFFLKDDILNCVGKNFGYIYTKEEYSNYKLHIEWCFPKGKTNSGIFLYLDANKEESKLWPSCVECQLMSGRAGDFILMNAPKVEIKRPNGTVRLANPSKKSEKPSSEVAVGEWNKADIICVDGKIQVYINGSLQNETTSEVKSGHIGLQSEGGYILFKNITVEKL